MSQLDIDVHSASAQPTELPARSDLGAPDQPRPFGFVQGLNDRIFKGVIGSSGAIVLGIMTAVGLFLAIRASDALSAQKLSFFTETRWEVDTGNFGVASLLGFTVLIALVAVVVAGPISLMASLFITEVAPPRLRSTLIAIIDLMAAVPSVVYGLWGFFLLQGHIIGVSRWLNTWFGWIPLFSVDGANPTDPLSTASVYTGSTFIAGLVVAMMIVPIQTTVMREVFAQVPPGEREGAYALGSTRWGMIRSVALPFGRGGVIGGAMLGLGRALGETIAIFLIFTPSFDFTFGVLRNGTNAISPHIALRQPEATEFSTSALMAAGLTLFGVTLGVNYIASIFIARSRSGASSDA